MRVRIRTAAPRETGGLFLLRFTPQVRRVPYTLSALIDQRPSKSIAYPSRNQSNAIVSLAPMYQTTEQKPGTVRDRLNEHYDLGLLSRHGTSRAVWNVREPQTQKLLRRRPTSKW